MKFQAVTNGIPVLLLPSIRAVSYTHLDVYKRQVCANACPAKEKALVMKPLAEEVAKQEQFDYARKEVEIKTDLPFKPDTVKGLSLIHI